MQSLESYRSLTKQFAEEGYKVSPPPLHYKTSTCLETIEMITQELLRLFQLKARQLRLQGLRVKRLPAECLNLTNPEKIKIIQEYIHAAKRLKECELE